jgi:hypothetical protein
MKRLIGLTALCAIAGIGCGDDDGPGMMDAGADVVIVIDSGPADTAVPMDVPRVDGGPMTVTGIPCDDVRGCPTDPAGGDSHCITATDLPNVAAGIAGGIVTADTVAGLPGGATGVPATLFPDGYCQPPCSTDADCGTGATCLGADAETGETGNCFASCTYNRDDNGGCRDGYACLRATATGTEGICYSPHYAIGEAPGLCDEGNDTICQVERCDENDGAAGDCVDNGIEGVQTPGDCAESPSPCAAEGVANPANNYDRLWFNADNPTRCNNETHYCEHPGDDTADVGDTCEEDWDCPTNAGLCLTFDVSGTDTSYCTSLDCDLGGDFACGAGNVCNLRALGAPACLESCTTGGGAGITTNPATWRTNDGGCAPGFGCYWDGMTAASAANGACVPGVFNDVTTPNTGTVCDTDDDCWSPFGRGTCIEFNNGVKMCTVRDCLTPLAPFAGSMMPDQGCGQADAVCVGISPDDESFGACFQSCTVGDDCDPELDCAPILAGGASVCFVGCEDDEDCHSGETCMGATATELGSCM